MKKRMRNKYFAFLMAFVMVFTMLTPMVTYAEETVVDEEEIIIQDATTSTTSEETNTTEESTEEEEYINDIQSVDNTTPEVNEDEENEETSSVEESSEIEAAASYEEFISALKILENYAESFSKDSNADITGLVINYIRTGIEKYNTDSWAILAGAENTEFKDYVKEQDALYGTKAQSLKGIDSFLLPNGQEVEFTHMFGALNIAYYNNFAQMSSDFGSWAGDLCDLIEYANEKAEGDTVDALADDIRTNYLGIDDPNAHSFGYLDILGDLDACYLAKQLSTEKTVLSSIMESYFTETLDDEFRATAFLKNRFPGEVTKEAIRTAIYNAYKSNSGAIMLEADRGLTSLNDLRYASCYAFADYLYELAKDNLDAEEPENPVDPVDPEEPEDPVEPDNPYYSVFSSSTQTLAPGLQQDIKYAITADDKQIVYYIATVDVNRDDLTVCANYNNNDGSSWAMSRVSDQMAAAQAKHSDPNDAEHYIKNYNAVLGVNADFFNMTTGTPSGALVMEGVEYQGAASEDFFAILKDGTPIIGSRSQYNELKPQIQEAVGVNMFLVKDGQITVKATDNYYKDRAPRTCVGITADNKVVLMALDGRQEPFSVGGSAIEIAQIMLEAGCVTAVNLDGGGSTTFAAKEEGADKVTIVNRPSDGYERSVSTSLMVVSTAETSNEFDHALLDTETDYFTVKTSMPIEMTGVSKSGNSADIPENAILRVNDETRATITDNMITAKKRGDVTVELVVDDVVVGSKTLHIVVPNFISFTKKSINAVYGSEVPLPLVATYNGNPITLNDDDVTFTLSSPSAGTISNFKFVGNENSGAKVVTITADLTYGIADSTSMNVSMFNNGEAIFDFENATNGDESLAWDREVDNSITDDNKVYHVIKPEEGTNVSYVFALDMREIKIPEQLKDMVALLPGGDSPDASAWGFLLQLAERVSVLTEVNIQFKIDPNMDIDITNLKFVNEYFEMTDASFDEDTHTLNVKVNWINQSQAINPDTADPVCILSGMKMRVKEDANWINNTLNVINTGVMSYDIYLRASTLYGVASDPSIQEAYGIYPFINPNDTSERGGHFGTTYAEFKDEFTLDRDIRNGWIDDDDRSFYYKDNVPVTGIQYLPGRGNDDDSYYFRFDENGVCLGKVTGLFEMDDDLYYAVNGKGFTGWRLITTKGEDQYYFFDPKTGKAVDGEQTIYGYHYTFTNHILTHGDLVKNETGIHYKWAGEWVTNSWVEVDGNKYYAGKAPYGYFIDDIHYQIHKYGSDTELGYGYFDENAVWQESFSGLYTDNYDNTYLIDNGYLVEGAGLVYIDGYYYYFRTSTSTAVKNRSYWITITNGFDIPEGTYSFDENGRMINPPTVVTPEEPETPEDPDAPAEPEVKNGIVSENGSLYYYENGAIVPAGLIQIDGDYYYVRTSTGEVVHDRSYWVTKTNDLPVPTGTYSFDSDGKMIDPPEVPPVDPEEPETPDEPTVKNGIIAENGSLYYYVNGKITAAGLIEIDGDYYYVRTSNGEVIHGRSYWVAVTNGLPVPEGIYSFDANGKMINPPVVPENPETPEEPAVKNGIVAENGSLYYYENGTIAAIGLIQIDGDYYYVRTSNGEVIHGRSYWVTKTNGLPVAEGSYNFDADGKMIR